jgi:hypothetical protein
MVASMLLPTETHAEGAPVRWSLAVAPDTCDLRRLVREVDLACDALDHACTVAMDAPDHRALVRCAPDGPWTLEVYDAQGRVEWTLAIDGDDRMHRAALWIARTAKQVGKADARSSAASEPLPPPPQASSPPSPQQPSSPPSALAAPSALAPSPSPAAPSAESPWGLSAAARMLLSSGFDPVVGGQLAAGWLVKPPNLALEVEVAGERGLAEPAGYSFAAFRAEAGVAFGAPWGSFPIGAEIGAGVLVAEISAPSSYSPAAGQFVHPYGRACIAVQWPARKALHPYAALSLIGQTAPVHVTSNTTQIATVPAFAAAFEIGLAWRPL